MLRHTPKLSLTLTRFGVQYAYNTLMPQRREPPIQAILTRGDYAG